MKRVAVIGGGIGGLAAAALLLSRGYDVVLVEKNSRVGGRASWLEIDGHGFDMGPTWYLMHDIYSNYFRRLGFHPGYMKDLVRLDPYFTMILRGRRFEIGGDLEGLASDLEEMESGAGDKLRWILRRSWIVYRAVVDKMLYRSYRSPLDMISPEILWIAGLLRSAQRMLDNLFKSREIKILLGYDSLFLGTPPWELPSLYLLVMLHSVFSQGVLYPRGGMRRIPIELAEYVEDKGGEILTGCEARRIEVRDGLARYAETSCGRVEADLFIANADYAHVELDLLDERYRSYDERYWLSRKLAPSAFIVYLGLERELREPHHLVVINSWEDHFESIFKNPSWPSNPSYYIHNPYPLNDSEKPGIMVLVPVAPGLKTSWRDVVGAVVRKVEKDLGAPIRARICSIFTPADFERRYNSFLGTALGLRHTMDQTGYWRPSLRSRRVKNLYYVGQYTHPGIGVPMVLASAQIAVGLIEDEL